jgi:hypothetical protein
MRRPLLIAASIAALTMFAGQVASPDLSAESDLDAFMRTVLAGRDDNWRKLQQYILDEREQVELRGPSRTPVWGEQRDYMWYLRDGFFVRSPLKVNGAAVSESERRKYEAEYLKRAQQRDERGPTPTTTDAPKDTDALIRQARQPQFISSAYFLRFKFEEGKYALVGHETVDGRDTLRIEYYPARLFARDHRWSRNDPSPADKARAAEMERMLNKVALVTLWVEPASHQIIKYTFNNVAFDFLPASWLLHVDDVHASMHMGQPFPGVWLPRNVEFAAAATMAVGQFDVRYSLDYHDYRLADVASKVTIPGAQ